MKWSVKFLILSTIFLLVSSIITWDHLSQWMRYCNVSILSVNAAWIAIQLVVVYEQKKQ